MLNDDGHYNLQWLYNQPTHVLRYEARSEKLAGWEWRPRHWLLLALRQCQPASFFSR